MYAAASYLRVYRVTRGIWESHHLQSIGKVRGEDWRGPFLLRRARHMCQDRSRTRDDRGSDFVEEVRSRLRCFFGGRYGAELPGQKVIGWREMRFMDD